MTMTEMNGSGIITEKTNLYISGLLHRKDSEELSICVMIEDSGKSAEIRLPKASILSNHGYTDAELKEIIKYLKENYEEIKKTAGGINPMKAFMGR